MQTLLNLIELYCKSTESLYLSLWIVGTLVWEPKWVLHINFKWIGQVEAVSQHVQPLLTIVHRWVISARCYRALAVCWTVRECDKTIQRSCFPQNNTPGLVSTRIQCTSQTSKQKYINMRMSKFWELFFWFLCFAYASKLFWGYIRALKSAGQSFRAIEEDVTPVFSSEMNYSQRRAVLQKYWIALPIALNRWHTSLGA